MDDQTLNVLQRIEDRVSDVRDIVMTLQADHKHYKDDLDSIEKNLIDLEEEIGEKFKKMDGKISEVSQVPAHFWKKVMGVIGAVTLIVNLIARFDHLIK